MNNLVSIMMPNEEYTFIGRVSRKLINKGKREGLVNYLLTECGKELVLRQEGRSALSDPELDQLEGKKIKGLGAIQSYVLILSSYEIINES